jgi:aminoglycoside phosphotransferase (APT) family kinase protein
MVIEFVAGQALRLPDDPNDYAAQLARMLARLHDLPLAGLPDDLTDYNAREVAFLSAASPPHTMTSHRLGSMLWDSQRLELERVELADGVFLHGDYWPGNTLWSQQDLISVVDFEEVGVGDPALDVATAVVNLKLEPWPHVADRFVEVYRAETGRALDTLRLWKMTELRRSMPDIAAWLPSIAEIGPRPKITANELRADHERLILEVLG